MFAIVFEWTPKLCSIDNAVNLLCLGVLIPVCALCMLLLIPLLPRQTRDCAIKTLIAVAVAGSTLTWPAPFLIYFR